MDWGMQHRLAHIIPPATGRAVMLAVDHGYFLGPTSGLEQPRQVVTPLLPHGAVGVDMGRNIFQSDNPVGMIRAVRQVVHENKTADEAFRLFKGLQSVAA